MVKQNGIYVRLTVNAYGLACTFKRRAVVVIRRRKRGMAYVDAGLCGGPEGTTSVDCRL